jgi:hypothetical protein
MGACYIYHAAQAYHKEISDDPRALVTFIMLLKLTIKKSAMILAP